MHYTATQQPGKSRVLFVLLTYILSFSSVTLRARRLQFHSKREINYLAIGKCSYSRVITLYEM